MLFVQLDTGWVDNPKVGRAGWEAAGMHAGIMCIAKRGESDGWVDRWTLTHRYSMSDEGLDRLIEHELLEVDGDRVRVHDWLARNPSQAAIVAKRASKSDAGKRGNHSKYRHPGSFENCPKCQVVAGSDRTPSQCDPTGSPESESYPESKSDLPCDPLSDELRIDPVQVDHIRDVRRQVFRLVPSPEGEAQERDGRDEPCSPVVASNESGEAS